jgi:hypothetical protein
LRDLFCPQFQLALVLQVDVVVEDGAALRNRDLRELLPEKVVGLLRAKSA